MRSSLRRPMSEAVEHPTRRSQSANTRRYDSIARVYSTLEPLYLTFPPARRRAVAALGLKPGDTVLEIGAGTGRNFPYLVEAVGPSGTVIGVELLQQDATQLDTWG
jgi:ubiquinone/menaquinone biosynthesis C-methylase UbiE